MSSSLARTSRPASGPAQATRQQLDELDALLQRMLDLPVKPGDDAAPPDVAPPPTAEELPPLDLPPGLSPRSYPSSYMVVESNAPPLTPAPSSPLLDDDSIEGPVPGGRHDLVADRPEPEDQPAEPDGEEWVPFRSSWQPSAQTWAPLARTWEQARGRPDLPDPAPLISPPEPGPEPAGPSGPQVVTQPVFEVPPAPTPSPRPTPVTAAPAPPPLAPTPGGLLRPLVWFNAAFDLCLMPLGAPGRWLQSASGRAALGLVGVGCLVAAAALIAADGIGWTW